MGLFNRTAGKLNGRTVLLFAADPGDALTQAVHLYDPGVRSWPGRLIFANGVLLYGPVTVTPKLQQQAELPEGMRSPATSAPPCRATPSDVRMKTSKETATCWCRDWPASSAEPSRRPSRCRTLR